VADPEYDVVIVGSGAGGAAAAWALTTDGARVLLLEAGPAYDPASDYRLDRDDWERTRFPEKVPSRNRQSFAPMQRLDARWDHLRSWSRLSGRLVRTDRRAVWAYHHVVGLGGSTLHFTGEAHRLNPAAMRMRSRFGVGADWPLDYAALEPLYAELERLIGVAGPDRPLPPHPLCYASQKLAEGCRTLGLSFVANTRAALSRPYDDRPACNYCGNCTRGCPRLDKGTADLTFIRHAAATGRLTIKTSSPALRVETGADDRVTGVVFADPAGGRARATGRAYVLACGAVETPRLLLVSDGLANESGLVGRNLMETVAWNATGLHPEPLGSHRGLPADGIVWDYNAPDAIPGVIGGCRFTNGTMEADLVGPIAYARRVVGGFGRGHKAAMRQNFGRALAVGAVGESLPNDGTFVDLDPARRDAAGLPLARIHSRVDEDALKRLTFMAETSRAILKAAGAAEIVEEYGTYDAFAATHVAGTCRMGHDPRESVVDALGRSHRWRNLFIADASVFPSTGGGESPALTIGALAVRTGRGILARAARGAL
jgi:choline dehydrogenase-like flavoprotein